MQHTAWQRFLGDGTLAFLPLRDGRSSIVWSLPTARAEKLLAATPAEFERELEKDFDGALGKVQLASERLKFPLWRLSASATSPRAWRWWATPRTWCIRWRGRARISGCSMPRRSPT